MALAQKARQIRCSKCGYDGHVKTKGTDIGLWFILIIVLFSSLLFWPLIIPVVLMFFWLLSKPSKRICPECNYEEKSTDGKRL